MKGNLLEIVEHENAAWSKIFQAELEKNSDRKFSSFWWENYYDEISKSVNNTMIENGYETILEAGSGSGKATLLLSGKFKKTLLDISAVALKYARHIANKFAVNNINTVEADIFMMPMTNGSFDFVWNIGVIEHYEPDDIKAIIKEMVRVCAKTGTVAVGMPNLHSGPILKARLLKFLKFIPGYRIDTEKFYKTERIEGIFREVVMETNRKIGSITTEYFGSPLIMETPKFILKTIGRLISKLFRKNKFLILIVCKFE